MEEAKAIVKFLFFIFIILSDEYVISNKRDL